MRTRSGSLPAQEPPAPEEKSPPPLPDMPADDAPVQAPRRRVARTTPQQELPLTAAPTEAAPTPEARPRRRAAAPPVESAPELTEDRSSVETPAEAPRRRRSAVPPPVDDGKPSAETEAELLGADVGEPSNTVTALSERRRTIEESGGVSAYNLRMEGGFDAIVESVFENDVPRDYRRIMEGLVSSIKPSRSDYGTLVDALDDAEENAHKAIKLVAMAKLMKARHDVEAQAIEASMRDAAIAHLEKTQPGKRQTIADIDAGVVNLFHDEYRELKERKAKASAMVEYLQDMARTVQERARDLRVMVQGSRGA